MNNVEKNTGQTFTALDEDTALVVASESYISSLTPGVLYEDAELVYGMMESIHQAYDEHNVVADKPKKWQYPKVLPNICIANLILFKHEIRMIDYSGNPDDAVYTG